MGFITHIWSKRAWLPLVVGVAWLFLWAPHALGETVYLNTGESIQGKIVRVTDNTVFIESSKGFGILQIDRSDILLIEFENAKRDLSKTIGIGYAHRSSPSGVASVAAPYAVDAFSVKMWLDENQSVDIQLGFYSASIGGTKALEVLSLEGRYAVVFDRRANMDLYFGGGLSYIKVTDNVTGSGVDGTGTGLQAFLGIELFFSNMPNLGFSAEIGVGSQTVGDRSVTNISTTTFPTFSLRYYY